MLKFRVDWRIKCSLTFIMLIQALVTESLYVLYIIIRLFVKLNVLCCLNTGLTEIKGLVYRTYMCLLLIENNFAY